MSEIMIKFYFTDGWENHKLTKTVAGNTVLECINKFKTKNPFLIKQVNRFIIFNLLGEGSQHPILGNPLNECNKHWLQ